VKPIEASCEALELSGADGDRYVEAVGNIRPTDRGRLSTLPMNRLRTVEYQVVFGLIALLTFGSCAAVEAIPTAIDAAVVRAALVHFAKSKELAPPKPDRYIAVDPQTRPLSKSVSDDDYRREFAALMPRPPFAAVTNYLERNRGSYLIGSLSVSDRSIRVEKYENPWRDLTSPGSLVRTYVTVSLPGYSSDRTWAFVTFEWWGHLEGAEALYVLRQLSGRWTVVNAEYCFGLCAGNFVGEQ
jgi:hypothetical protein